MIDGQGGGVWAIMLALLFLMRGGWGHEGGGHHSEGYGKAHLDHVETNSNFGRTNAHIEAEANKAAYANMHTASMVEMGRIKDGVTFNTFEAQKGFDKLAYQSEKNTCEIVKAIDWNGEKTRVEMMRYEYENQIRHKDEIIAALGAKDLKNDILRGVAEMLHNRKPEFDGYGCRFAGV